MSTLLFIAVGLKLPLTIALALMLVPSLVESKSVGWLSITIDIGLLPSSDVNLPTA